MFSKVLIFFIFLAFVKANYYAPVPYAASPILIPQPAIDYYSVPKYDFTYGLNENNPVEYKATAPSEVRDAGLVKGSYSLQEPDGAVRTVQYSADDQNGFSAVVTRSLQGVNPETFAKSLLNSPLSGEAVNVRIGAPAMMVPADVSGPDTVYRASDLLRKQWPVAPAIAPRSFGFPNMFGANWF